MIWQSVTLMTVIVVIVFASLRMLYRQRHMLARSGLLVGAWVVVSGLLGIGLFYLADLFVMWGLPRFTTRATAMAVMEDLHLNYSWAVMLAVTVSIFVGFAYMIRGVFAQTTELQEEITRRRQAGKALRESEERYRRLLEMAPVSISVSRMDGTLCYVNEATLELLGTSSPEEIVGTNVYDYMKGSDRENAKARIQRLVKGKEVEPVERTIIRHDGEQRHVVIASLPITYEGQPAGQSVIIDITERKQAEEALRASEERYRRVVEDQTDYVMRWLLDGTVLFANDSYCQYFGKTSGELERANVFDLIPEVDHARLRQKVASLTPEHPFVREEHSVTRPDGSRGWHAWNDSAIFDETGRIVEYQSVGRDITERKQAEADLRRLNAELEERFR